METRFDQLKTARQIAREARVPLHKVDYAIQRLDVIENARVGIVRLYDVGQVARIREALSAIASRRTPLEGGGV